VGGRFGFLRTCLSTPALYLLHVVFRTLNAAAKTYYGHLTRPRRVTGCCAENKTYIVDLKKHLKHDTCSEQDSRVKIIPATHVI
jgi:hypothetical protein